MTLEQLQDAVLADPGAARLLEATAALPFHDDATAAIRSRVARAWEDSELLADALARTAGRSPREVSDLIMSDRLRWNDLLDENDRREAVENAKGIAA